MAAVLIETFEAPTENSFSISSRVEMPPPTVRGILITSETSSTHEILVLRLSTVAEMSSMANSSAPSC